MHVCWNAHKCRAGGDLVICCSRARDFNLDLQLSQGQIEGAEVQQETILHAYGPHQEDSLGGMWI